MNIHACVCARFGTWIVYPVYVGRLPVPTSALKVIYIFSNFTLVSTELFKLKAMYEYSSSRVCKCLPGLNNKPVFQMFQNMF